MSLPKPPKINIYPVNKESAENTPPFLKINRNWYAASYPNGTSSKPFLHDGVERCFMDAVGIVAHCVISQVRCIFLRSCVRPNLLERLPKHVNLWEIAAGLVEAGEQPIISAVRETEEELGFKVSSEQFNALGPFVLPSPGLGSERIFLFEVEVDPADQKKPTEDGGPLEKYGVVEMISLDTALKLVKDGEFKDAKTEIAIRRFADKYKK